MAGQLIAIIHNERSALLLGSRVPVTASGIPRHSRSSSGDMHRATCSFVRSGGYHQNLRSSDSAKACAVTRCCIAAQTFASFPVWSTFDQWFDVSVRISSFTAHLVQILPASDRRKHARHNTFFSTGPDAIRSERYNSDHLFLVLSPYQNKVALAFDAGKLMA